MYVLKFFFFIIYFLAILFSLTTVSSLISEKQALLYLLRNLTLPDSFKSSWNSSHFTPCRWEGIRCDHRLRVTVFNLSGYGISGQLGPEIGQLKIVKKIDLSFNRFNGVIPLELVNCSQLKHLDFSVNSFTGELPRNLEKLVHLRTFKVYHNSLSGEVPESLFGIPHLKFVNLSSNNFIGSIPLSVGNCREMQELYLNDNNLVGVLPESLEELELLTHLDVSSNHLEGRIPLGLGKCKNLIELVLSGNSFFGEIPRGLGNCSGLRTFDVANNRLMGDIPLPVWKIVSLEVIHVHNNSLSGELPWEITMLVNLRTISLYNNHFHGVIPPIFGSNTTLENLDFSMNMFSGEIPLNLCFGKRLKILNLGGNQLQSSIPSNLGRCSTLRRLILADNNLTGLFPEFTKNQNLSFLDISGNNINGTIPSSVRYCKNLTLLDFSMNKLLGPLPHELGNLEELQVLNLSRNHLQGPLPPEISRCAKLYSLDLGYNSFSGPILLSLRTLTQLSTLILSENKFSGGIPDFLSGFQMLLELQLGGNLLEGSIPSSLAELENLSYGLNLSRNLLTGQIPQELGKLRMLQRLDISCNKLTGSLASFEGLTSLLELNVSYNRFNGSVPEEFIKFLYSPSSFFGNPGLCVPQNFGGNINLPTCGPSSITVKGINRVNILLIAFASSLLGVICLLGSTYMVIWYVRPKQVPNLLPMNGIRSIKDFHFSQEKIMEATENLNEKFIIGRGAHGTVYKATLKYLRKDRLFAIKKIVFIGQNCARMIMEREIQFANLKHQNLVKLEHFLLRRDYRLIVYKYMSNGSLHDVLHEMSPTPHLNWGVRYKIALGTAAGLAYLHNEIVPAVVHQDIKPSNILLDSDMEPKISDFGISKFMDPTFASIHTITVIGTVGYIAPEITYTMMKNEATDVYSYGVVLLELITRKKVMDPSLPDGVNIVKWVHSVWKRTGNVNGLLDPSLVTELANPFIRVEVFEVLAVALQCTETISSKRPTMKEVVSRLQTAKEVTRQNNLCSSSLVPCEETDGYGSLYPLPFSW
ncbi:hypothetical protein GIB67_022562 [Kingdonia uniflora]|uniref:non-specific serine/threonine protein kinase n=1 Tax=Kingdonia uniflora TaxID=39325 RepID=A0A7J7L7L1_9MAGN|nr:hypothetical protein GIB67_022562 [Kingdonia uniflora]